MYLTMGYVAASFGFLFYDYFHHLYVEDTTVKRYKKNYTIFRPDDLRTKFYPKHYITDAQLLPKDHPETTFEGVDNLKQVLYGDKFNNRV